MFACACRGKTNVRTWEAKTKRWEAERSSEQRMIIAKGEVLNCVGKNVDKRAKTSNESFVMTQIEKSRVSL